MNYPGSYLSSFSKRILSASTVWKVAALTCLLIITISLTSQSTVRESQFPEAAAIKIVIENTPSVLSYLLTNGTLIISSENIEGVDLPDTIGKVKVKVMSPAQIQDLADSINYFYYLRVDSIDDDSKQAVVHIRSHQAMSCIAYYQTMDWSEVNATVDTLYFDGKWVTTRALIDLCFTSSDGVGIMIRLAIDSPADYYEFKSP
jgi:hypothetical protein